MQKLVPYEDYLGTKLFHPGYKPDIVQAVSLSQKLNLLILDLATKKHQQTKKPVEYHIKELKQQADKIINGMIADVSSTRVTRLFGFMVKNMLQRMYHLGVHVREDEIHRLRDLALEAQERGISLVFLPCHKSHIDYLVVSYVLYVSGIALPHIAAGDNLNLPLIGMLLRGNGAFFIRRQWGDDKLYAAIMQEYIKHLLKKGYNLEAFIEGTRSRTGKLLPPKFGILKIILDAVLSGSCSDAYVVPVSIGYDKVIETPTYQDELMGTPKVKESLGQLLTGGFNLLQLKWGRIDVRFGKHLSLKDFIDESRSLKKPKSDTAILQALGYQTMSSINNISVIMPTALVGTILLTLRGRGVGRNELIRKVIKLRKEIRQRGGSVAEFDTESYGEVVERAIKVLGELIGRRFDILEPVYYPMKRFALSYYRNQVIHLFVHEAIMSVGMYTKIKAGGSPQQQRIHVVPNLMDDVSFISQLLKFEFVYQGQGLEGNVEQTIQTLVKSNVITLGEDEQGRWITLSDDERRIGRETFDFYCFLLWPFIETYWLAAVSLYTLVPPKNVNEMYWVPEQLYMKRCQIFGKTLYYEGDLSYFEAVNKETLGNAITRLQQMGLIKVFKGSKPPGAYNGTSNAWVGLSREWVPAERLPEAALTDVVDFLKTRRRLPLARRTVNTVHESVEEETEDFGFENWYKLRPKGRLWDFCEHIGRFRREGKNRRDTSTVATRVLRLARHAVNWGETKKQKKESKL
ncbi:acyltransferase-domain-containing protein [Gorgonomyces haynaldii]|nr:acyltransferase-domain-containing protein [Gorgonomyces haynaldii]